MAESARASEDVLVDKGTVGDALTPSLALSATQTAAASLSEDIGFFRSAARNLHEDFGNLHKRSIALVWRVRTGENARKAPSLILAELSDLGFSWRDIARVAGVSVAAVQKWRKGSGCTPETRLKLAGFLAACEEATESHGIQEVASWFEMPVTTGSPITPLDLYVGDRADLVFQLASGHVDPEQILTDFMPDWRERYRSRFEVFEDHDGYLSIRSRDGS